jgi:ubiquinone/menaquinone biosynthesis C-methylase UbiE
MVNSRMFDENPTDSIETRNRSAYDRMARSGHVLATVATAEEMRNPLPALDGSGWLGQTIRGWNVLCLAAGGGRHSALYHAAGANVTVVDISDGMLELDRRISQVLRFHVRLIQATMANMPMLRDAEFDLVVQPVSTCYVTNLPPVFSEVSRILKPNGLYISQHKNPVSLQSSLKSREGKYVIETEQNNNAIAAKLDEPTPLREPYTIEVAHSMEMILGGICRNGMVIEAFVEPDHINRNSPQDTIGHRSKFIPPYFRVKARKASASNQPSQLLLPTM